MPSNELLVRRAGVAVRGPRPPMVFVHGVINGAWCWEYYLDYFAQHGHDCYALGLRGHGGSPGRDGIDQFGLDHYVDDVAELVRTLPKSVIVGHSMGGAITQMFLAKHDDLISAAVLFASAQKSALAHFTKNLAREYGPRGIRANSVLPGMIVNEQIAEKRRLWMAETGGSEDQYFAETNSRWGTATCGTRLGVPEDVADAIAFLVSALASYVHSVHFMSTAGPSTSSCLSGRRVPRQHGCR